MKVISNFKEYSQFINHYHWENTPLGPIQHWPDHLHILVSSIIHNPLPMLIMWGQDGLIIYNEQYAVIAGDRHPSILGRKVTEAWPEAAVFNHEILTSVLNKASLSFKDQKFNLTRNNIASDAWFDLNYSPIFHANGETIGVLSIIIETTSAKIAEYHQKLAEQNLQARQEYFKALVKTSSEIFYIMSPDWTELSIMEGDIFIQNTGEKSRDWFKNNIPDEHKILVKDHIEKAIKSESVFALEHKVKLADGQIGWISSKAFPLKNNLGEIVQWVGTASNITNRKIAEETIVQKNKQLLKINDELDNFVYVASHDLKAPIYNLDALVVYLEELLDTKITSEDIATTLQLMQQSIERFKKTINDLSDVAKVQRQQVEDEEDVSLETLVREVMQSINGLIIQYKAKIIFDFSEVPTLKFSLKNLRSVFYNLLSNGIKYSSPDRPPEVTVKSFRSNDATIVTFTDNGLGISEKDKDKVFMLFKRFHPQVEGSGVGMTIVKRIMDNCDGRIEVESRVDKGTTFRLYFPSPR